ncbi:hypothetical protein EXIGLDRAFT_720910 [Exidia glandulosa HHB12029]|uniref:DUF3752 domain-containing protein n=1 Tax=Exidia glandulosa HHB12029 TaxID=1314781 RepID=A0A166BFS6_EXIGL|nr:hypothetical protein EXIGLDRAFT_720910 [Exidia glandulosa HHB12029]
MAPAKSQRPAPSPPRVAAPAAARQPQRPMPGPSLPPPAYDDDSEDEDVGPRPLPAHLQHDEEDGVRALIEREERKAKNLEESKKPKKLERQEWMLKPPTSSDLLGSLDPTKLQGKRTFNKGTTDARAMADNLWTETPQERQKRIQDEVMGKKRRAAEAAADPDGDRDSAKRRKHDEELRRAIQGHASRAESLVDMHERTLAEKPTEKDDEIWNHDRDISKGKLPMDASSRKKLITDARGLSDRFGSGKSGSFL